MSYDNCPECKEDWGRTITDKGLACSKCGHLFATKCPHCGDAYITGSYICVRCEYLPEELSGAKPKPEPVCGAYKVITSADGTEEIASITLNTNGAHIDIDEAMALVEIFTRHTQRFIRNKLVKRAN